MQRSYLGIGTARELKFWTPETQDAHPFIFRRARRVRGAICFWAVVPESAACEISALLQEGRRAQALETLNESAIDAGRMLPDDR